MVTSVPRTTFSDWPNIFFKCTQINKKSWDYNNGRFYWSNSRIFCESFKIQRRFKLYMPMWKYFNNVWGRESRIEDMIIY